MKTLIFGCIIKYSFDVWTMYAICALALVVGNLGLFAAAVKAGPDCKYDKYDFSSLKGKSFAVVDVDGRYT